MTLDALRKKNRKPLQRGNAAAAVGAYEAAERHYREYLARVPGDPKVLFNLGAIRQFRIKGEKDQVRVDALRREAIGLYCDAIESPHPDPETKSDALNNQGLAMGALGHYDKAKICFHLALQLNPLNRAARLNFADILVADGEHDEADEEFFEIINSDPQGAGAQFSRSMLMLMTGDIRRGFREYRARFRVPSFVSKLLQTEKPIWKGEAMNGKTLIVTGEQGHGDSLQFVRYFAEIKKRWPESRILFAVADSMHLLLKGCVGLDGCLPDHLTPEFKAACPDFDYHAPLLHLPDILGTTLETIPASVPYILPHADWLPLPIPRTYDQMDEEDDDFIVPRNIGLCWAGSPLHGKDKWRSATPELFQRFIDAAPDDNFYSLQCGPRAHETEQLTNCVNLPALIHDWTHTANAILQMDLVISVDTAVAHLAGALGKPAWILLPSSPDWRWMLTREDSPWYPKARLFRQPARGEWEPVSQRVCEALK